MWNRLNRGIQDLCSFYNISFSGARKLMHRAFSASRLPFQNINLTDAKKRDEERKQTAASDASGSSSDSDDEGSAAPHAGRMKARKSGKCGGKVAELRGDIQ